MAAKKQGSSYEAKLALYEKMIATNPEITRKGNVYAYTSHKGHMFSLLKPSGEMGLRLPKNEREDFLKEFETTLFESHGTVMKEYVAVPPSLLGNTRALARHLLISLDYIKSLKPKATTKQPSRITKHKH
jgi:hypothetical protein